jgi:hypothetical protein
MGSREAVRMTRTTRAGVAQLVERQPSKLYVEGSNPFSRSIPGARAGHAGPSAHRTHP